MTEPEAFLEAHSDVEAVEAFVTDPNGVARGKLLRICELAALYATGRPMPGSIMSLDSTGLEIGETGLIWERGDADVLARPVAGSLRRMPWRSTPTGQLLLSLWEADGTPHAADPRHVLARVVAMLEGAGYVPVVAAELEFYVVDPVRAADGQLRPPVSPRTRERLEHHDIFSVTELDDFAPFLDDLFAAAAALGVPAETVISEYAPGQFEIGLHHRADALRAADEAVRWKRLVRGVAANHGLVATFMAKPFTGRSGSGLHIHASLQDSAGRNLFASDDRLLHHAIGGLLAALDESLGVFAPNANSYRRFEAMSYAPVAPTWGINNRTVAVRIPAGPSATRHLEHRVAGADANPYLAIAAVLAGIRHGIVERLDPGPPIEGNGYARAGPRLAEDWPAALRKLRDSGFLAHYFGARFLEIYLAIKTTECRRFHARVTELDLDWYLTRA